MSFDVNSDMKTLIDVVRQSEDNKHFEADNGQEYVIDGEGNIQLLRDPIAEEPLCLSQLTSLMDWLAGEGNQLVTNGTSLMINVASPTRVEVLGELNNQGKRPLYVAVEAIIDRNRPFGRFLSQEEMVIFLQSQFIHNGKSDVEDDRDIVLRVVSNLRDEQVKQQIDDGVTQTVKINSGVATVDEVKVPNPVKLIPYRTFQEVAQPASNFIFRMQEGMRSALFLADNNQWQVEAKNNIKRFINEEQQKMFDELKYPVLA